MAYQPKSYKKFVATAATATLVATAVVPAALADEVKPAAFTDVAPQYAEAVEFVVSQNISNGYNETQYGVHRNIIRGDAAIQIARAAGLNDEKAPYAGFGDVPTRGVLATNSLKAAGVTQGKTATNFGFYDNITRGEAAVFIAKAFKLEGDAEDLAFTDVIGTRYDDAVAALVAAGVTNGKTATQFGTHDDITRGEMARWLHALEDLIVPEPEVPGTPGTDPEAPGNELGDYELEVSFGKTSLVGNGADNTQVTLTIKNRETGAVATDADNLVLEMTTSHGTLGQDRVTVQDGVANVTLTSEYTREQLTATVQAKLIEAAADSDWQSEIGRLVDNGTVTFTPVSSVVDETTVPSLLTAESNEADRVTLYFDKAVNPGMYLEMENGQYVVDADGNVVFRNDTDGAAQLSIEQLDGDRTIRGLVANPANPNSLIAILDVQDYEENPALTPNAQVFVESGFLDGYGESLDYSAKTFTFTDSRSPELTGVEVTPNSMSQITLKFSEPVTYDYAANATIRVNGQTITVANIVDGEFWQNLGDYRDEIVVNTQILNAGDNSVQVSGVEDYAGNVVSSETLDFTVPGITTLPAATVEVESPEQVRLNWNVPVTGFTPDEVNFQYWLPSIDPDSDVEGTWVEFPEGVEFESTEIIPGVEYVYELNEDWTQFIDELYADLEPEMDSEDFEYPEIQVRATVNTDAVTNPVNGLTNERQVLSLNYNGSPLNTFDTASPQIVGDVYRYNNDEGDYVGYVVEFNEPVKAPGLDVADTPSVLQGETIPEVVIEFRGTDEDGNNVVIDGAILGYFPDYELVDLPATSADNAFIVDATEANLQALVDSGYGTEWELVVRNVTDDVGNAATTVLSDQFTINPTPAPAEIFTVFNAEYDGVDFDVAGDQIILDFTAPVSFTGGTRNALELSNYTVNGLEIPDGASIELSRDFTPDFEIGEDYWFDTVNGDLSIVTITLPEGTLNEDGNNVINISEELMSRLGTEISGKLEVTQDEAGTVTPEVN